MFQWRLSSPGKRQWLFAQCNCTIELMTCTCTSVCWHRAEERWTLTRHWNPITAQRTLAGGLALPFCPVHLAGEEWCPIQGPQRWRCPSTSLPGWEAGRRTQEEEAEEVKPERNFPGAHRRKLLFLPILKLPAPRRGLLLGLSRFLSRRKNTSESNFLIFPIFLIPPVCSLFSPNWSKFPS